MNIKQGTKVLCISNEYIDLDVYMGQVYTVNEVNIKSFSLIEISGYWTYPLTEKNIFKVVEHDDIVIKHIKVKKL